MWGGVGVKRMAVSNETTAAGRFCRKCLAPAGLRHMAGEPLVARHKCKCLSNKGSMCLTMLNDTYPGGGIERKGLR